MAKPKSWLKTVSAFANGIGNLENRVKGRMVVLDISATGEENIIEYNENKEMNDLEYRKIQLKSLQDKVWIWRTLPEGIWIRKML